MSELWYEAEKEAKKLSFFETLDSHERRKLIESKLKKKASELSEKLVDAFNTMGVEKIVAEGILEGIQKSHRHLQGEFWTGMLNVMEHYGKTKWFDPRNEFAVKMCQRMAKAGNEF